MEEDHISNHENDQALNHHMYKIQIRTKKYDSKDAKVWALFEWYDKITHSRVPIVRCLAILELDIPQDTLDW
jgi:hypothetical protein